MAERNGAANVGMGAPGRTTAGSRTILDVLAERRRLTPTRVAYWLDRTGDGPVTPVTYGEFGDDIERLARQLTGELARGAHVVLLFGNPLDYLAGLLACQMAGMIPVSGLAPVAPRLRTQDARRAQRLRRVQTVFGSSAATVGLGDPDVVRAFARAFEQAGPNAVRWLSPEREVAYDRGWEPCHPDPQDLAFIQYTSGSTDVPSGVMVSHENLAANLAAHVAVFALGEQDVGVSWLPFYHDLGLIEAGLLPLFANFPCALMTPVRFSENPYRWLELISSLKGTMTSAPNFAYDVCTDRITEEQLGRLDLRSWRVGGITAEPVVHSTITRFCQRFGPCGFRATTMTPAYGLAEATLVVTVTPPHEEPRSLRLNKRALGRNRVEISVETAPPIDCVTVSSCGRPVPGTVVRIVDPTSFTLCDNGALGEVWVAGPSIASGYVRSSQRSEEVFGARLASGAGPFLRTGDLGFIVDGDLYVSGRLKDTLIVHGLNLHAHDVEQTVEASHPALRQHASAVFPILVDGRECPAVICEAHRGQEADAWAAAEAVRRALFEDWVIAPHVVAVVRAGTVPKTPSGKVQRRLCRDGLESGSFHTLAMSVLPATSAGTPRADEPEGDLTSWILAQLRVKGDSMKDLEDVHFADLGIDSLQFVQLAKALELRFGVMVDLAELFETSTLRGARAYLEGQLFGHRASSTATSRPPDERRAGLQRLRARKRRLAAATDEASRPSSDASST